MRRRDPRERLQILPVAPYRKTDPERDACGNAWSYRLSDCHLAIPDKSRYHTPERR